MTATITDLKKWREEHPPALRLLTIWGHCYSASWRLYSAWLRAVMTMPMR